MKIFSFSYQRIVVFSFSLLSLLLISGCGSGEKLVSTWPGQPIKIDGNSQDWQGSLQTFPKEQYSVGFKNDDKYLYICFITSDGEKISKIMNTGLNVVFNSPKDERMDYTINFPVVNPDAMKESIGPGMGNAMPAEGSPMSKPGDSMPKGRNSSFFQQILDRQLNFNLIEKDYTNSISLKNTDGIDLKMGVVNDLLVYEMKIPLMSAKSSFPIGALPGEIINIKIEPAQMKMPAKGGKPGGKNGGIKTGTGDEGGDDMQGSGDMQGNRRPGPGGRGGRGGNMQGAPGYKTNEKFSAEFSIQLSKDAGIIKN